MFILSTTQVVILCLCFYIAGLLGCEARMHLEGKDYAKGIFLALLAVLFIGLASIVLFGWE